MSKDDKNNSVYAAIQQPAPLQQGGNMAANWREWSTSFDYFLIALGKETVSAKEKCALFMHVIGKFGREILEELDIDEVDRQNYTLLCQKFVEYCDPMKNINYERHMFFETYQQDISFDKFLGLLKVKSKNCEFGTLRNSLILTQLIRGLNDVQMKEKLLAKSKLTLEEAAQWCRAAERAGQQASACAAGRVEASDGASASAAVEQLGAATDRTRGTTDRGRQRRLFSASRGRQQSKRVQVNRNYNKNSSVCGKCGYDHSVSDKCAAYLVKCYRCERTGHFARCCRAKFTREITDGTASDDGEDYDCENGELLMYNISIESVDCTPSSWTENIKVNDVDVKFKLDSGADASVMSFDCFKKLGFNEYQLKKCKTILREISKKKLPVLGYLDAKLKHDDKVSHQKIFILDVNCNNLLGLRACMELNLIKRINNFSLNNLNIDSSIFEGIGCLPTECNIQIDKTVAPVVNSTRKIPIKIRSKLKSELDNMEKLGIIMKEEEPTDWVSSIVVIEKPNKSLRVCLDPKNLNKAVKRSHFQLPTLEEISSNLTGAKYFSKCDAKNGFWMVKLNEVSSKLCTFTTPFGRYRFLRLPFGINCAPEIFHKKMYDIFKMEGVEVYIDDIMIWGRTREEHDKRVQEVFKKAKENGVKFNRDKCVFGAAEINFLGHTFNCNGMRPDEKRVSAISVMPTPSDKKDLERFLGITNYLSRFIHRYSETSAPLRELLSKKVQFEWLPVHEKAFQCLKNIICCAPVLRYYSPTEPVTVSVDASSQGLGACLLQGGRPVAYAARTLTPTERRWAQIEKELLAVTFGCTRFHQYIYGHDKVTVETDHKPLEVIFKKQLCDTPARLQRLLLKLQHYCIELKYKPGKLLFIADTLSRAAVEHGTDGEVSQDVTVHVNALYDNVEATPEMLSRIKEETSKDLVLLTVSEYYRNGWPDNKKKVKDIVKPYWEVHNELHIVNGVLFRNERVVMPKTLRKEMLRRIHEGHMGIEKCQRRARDVMWWPGMSAEISRVVEDCETCQRHRAANPREPLTPHPVPQRPWEVLAADLFEFRHKHYLLVVDYYSKFVEIQQLAALHSINTIAALKTIFSRFGIPKMLITDNGPQFSAEKFKEFAMSWEFEHVTSSPHYPRSNGLAERNVRTVKLLLTKALESGEDWQMAMLNFRNTPITGENYSPAQLLMSRRLHTRLPACKKILLPKTVNKHKAVLDRYKRINKYTKYYDRGTRNLTPLQPNEHVKLRDNKVWVNAKVIKKARGDRSYWVQTDSGQMLRRNRQHLMNLPCKIRNVPIVNKKGINVDWEHVYGSSELSPCRSGVSQSVAVAGSSSGSHESLNNEKGVVTRSGRIVRPPNRLNL